MQIIPTLPIWNLLLSWISGNFWNGINANFGSVFYYYNHRSLHIDTYRCTSVVFSRATLTSEWQLSMAETVAQPSSNTRTSFSSQRKLYPLIITKALSQIPGNLYSILFCPYEFASSGYFTYMESFKKRPSCLVSFTQSNIFTVHPCWSTYQLHCFSQLNDIPSYG